VGLAVDQQVHIELVGKVVKEYHIVHNRCHLVVVETGCNLAHPTKFPKSSSLCKIENHILLLRLHGQGEFRSIA